MPRQYTCRPDGRIKSNQKSKPNTIKNKQTNKNTPKKQTNMK